MLRACAKGAEGPSARTPAGGRTVDLPAVDLDFALVVFDGESTAAKRFAQAREQSAPGARWAREIGLVEHHHNGRLLLRGTFAGHYLDVDESDHVSQTGAGGGAVAGGLIGALAGPPGIAVGIVVGGIAGAELGTPTDGEAEPLLLVERLREAVPRSSSAIVLIAAAAEVDEMLAALSEEGGRSSRERLTDEQASALQTALASAPAVSPGLPD